jgi:hypothetical protein
MIEAESADMAGDQFEPWILELNGVRRLPAFSSEKTMKVFVKTISQQMNKVFALGGAEFLIEDITKDSDIEFVDLNLFSHQSWESTSEPDAILELAM